jgi:hypothetical protein
LRLHAAVSLSGPVIERGAVTVRVMEYGEGPVMMAAAPCWALYPGAIAGPVAQSHSRSRKRSARLTGAARRERSRIEDQKERERDIDRQRQTDVFLSVCQKVTVIAAALQGPRVVARGVRAV